MARVCYQTHSVTVPTSGTDDLTFDTTGREDLGDLDQFDTPVVYVRVNTITGGTISAFRVLGADDEESPLTPTNETAAPVGGMSDGSVFMFRPTIVPRYIGFRITKSDAGANASDVDIELWHQNGTITHIAP